LVERLPKGPSEIWGGDRRLAWAIALASALASTTDVTVPGVMMISSIGTAGCAVREFHRAMSAGRFEMLLIN
jgi:hypothetical protein